MLTGVARRREFPFVLPIPAVYTALAKDAKNRVKTQEKPALTALTASSKTVGFRLDPHFHALLAERAAAGGESPGETARKLVTAALGDESELSRIRERLLAIDAALSALRTDLALTTEALLVFAGKSDLDAAKKWVATNLKTRPRRA